MNRHYPKRFGNQFRLRVDGDRFLPAMLDAIASAERFILLETYLCESGRLMDAFIDALGQACRRGVEVFVLLDDFGSLHLSAQDRQRLREAGVALRFFNPLRLGAWRHNLRRDHRKLLLVDGRIGFIGGAGLTDDFDPRLRPQRWWHDLMLEIHGDCLLDLQHSFARVWKRAGADRMPPQAKPAAPARPQGGAARLLLHERHRREILATLIRHIRRARRRVLISVAYFVPPRSLTAALRRAARRGVDVQLILPGPITDHGFARYAGRRHYGRLLRAGVRIHEYQPRFTHVKLMICDDRVSVGSANLDHWTLRWNLEANLEIEDAATLEACLAMFRADLAAAQEIKAREWQQRSRWLRLQEWFWGLLSDWLARRSYRLGLRNPERHPPRDWRS